MNSSNVRSSFAGRARARLGVRGVGYRRGPAIGRCLRAEISPAQIYKVDMSRASIWFHSSKRILPCHSR